MSRSHLALVALALVGASQTTAQAWLTEGWYSFKDHYNRNNCWPQPYAEPDRVAANTAINLMVTSGWRRQNLLGEGHFDSQSKQLNRAGELKVHWVMTQSPPDRRTVFVSRDVDPQVTAARIQSVRQFASTVGPDVVADIQETHLLYEGRPAAIIDTMNTRFLESQPAPVLPAVDHGTEK